MSKLTEMAIKKAKPEAKPYKMADGGGLYLLVLATGAKYWRFKYRILGVEKTLALGVYPDVSLTQAREGREDARKLLKNKTDPSAIKQATKQATKQEERKISQVAANSFKVLATEFHALKSPMWTAQHAKQWMGNMEKYAFPVIGDRSVSELEPMELLGICAQ